ncbi:hypothetical protein [Homoserinibacter sp. GY 40078]|uniref:hypothetical protein n=1 Tax=Homoserinibacter sp. GY 40078 TaxID=2603275 RepID=UPI0011C90CE8|nr:hypothetical protein [Homoserinibacter sp. GY 40078]TXK17391.1 hypothetical protein FVQ89_11190 [Homoserinibacter sp. GY 40078]
MRFQMDIPDEQFWKLAGKAEQFDMKVPEYVADLCAVAASTSVPFDSDPVLQLWRARYTDAQIAARLSMTNSAVSSRRRRYGLPANRRRARDEGSLAVGEKEISRRSAHIEHGAFALDDQQRRGPAGRKAL